MLQLRLMSSLQPTQIIILGGAGDLAQRKLLPSLFDLFSQKKLPTTFRIIGLARTERTDAQYQDLVKAAVTTFGKKVDFTLLDAFCSNVSYVAGSFTEEKSYEALAHSIELFEKTYTSTSNRLFYLAVPPSHYEEIFQHLHKSRLADAQENGTWARILVEKPFGSNYDTARALDKKLSLLFREDQIFRIDHYLAKEAVQNILSFRFANTLLRNSWSSEHIKRVNITMHESINADSRGAFYDSVGALRDVGQNHLLQLLALITMDEPKAFTAAHIRECRNALLEKLVAITEQTVESQVVKAQYEGFTDTTGVRETSTTETYFEFIVYIDTPQWYGVSFCISGGKALKNDEVIIEIEFHDILEGAFKTKGNSIILTISPVQSMNVTLNVKRPGYGYDIEQNTLSFAWDEESGAGVNAYEKVLLDCIEGDQTLFTQTNEVLASWKFISSIIEHWDKIPLQTYQQGSAGPEISLCKNT